MIARVLPVVTKVLAAWIVVWAAMVGIGLLLTKVVAGTGLQKAEDQVNTGLAHHRTPELNDVTYVLSGLGNTAAIVGALAAVSVALWWATRRWQEPLFLIVAVSGQAIVFLFAQLVVTRQRPHVRRLDSSPPTSSFPSGHTGAATALFVASALLVAWYVRRRWLKILSVTFFLVVPLLVAYGRLYRGMHHPSDVLAAFLNGLACVAIASTFVLRRGWGRPRDPSSAPARTAAGAQ